MQCFAYIYSLSFVYIIQTGYVGRELRMKSIEVAVPNYVPYEAFDEFVQVALEYYFTEDYEIIEDSENYTLRMSFEDSVDDDTLTFALGELIEDADRLEREHADKACADR